MADALGYWCELRPLGEDGEDDPPVAHSRQVVVAPSGCARLDSGLKGCQFTGLAPGTLFEARLAALAGSEVVGAPCRVLARTLATDSEAAAGARHEADGCGGSPPLAREPTLSWPSHLEVPGLGRACRGRGVPGGELGDWERELVLGWFATLRWQRDRGVLPIQWRWLVSVKLAMNVAQSLRGELETATPSSPPERQSMRPGVRVRPRTAPPAPFAEPAAAGGRRRGGEGLLRPRQPKPARAPGALRVWQEGGIMGGLKESVCTFGWHLVAARPGAAPGFDAASTGEMLCREAFAKALSPRVSCASGLEITGLDTDAGRCGSGAPSSSAEGGAA
ncbi:unnamed protein product [Prorocentrum cordatum]|uniref:Uncharacterized protein n=1 Tax=Prorocentrum cordatum TaxID=2364126 RepID=A0ABN9V7Y2_9DINO|nr:unnamed protein product [Polarella glacialis]